MAQSHKRLTTAILILLSALFVSYTSAQQYFWIEDAAPARHLNSTEPSAADQNATTHITITNTTVTTTRVCAIRNEETGELETRPAEECANNDAELIDNPNE